MNEYKRDLFVYVVQCTASLYLYLGWQKLGFGTKTLDTLRAILNFICMATPLSRTGNLRPKKQCCGSGSVCFWISRIRIRHYLYGSGSSNNQSKKKKNNVFYCCDFFMTLKNDVNVLQKVKKNLEKSYFC
jgi:hypothetical protein